MEKSRDRESARMAHTRAVVRRVVQHADRRLTAAEIRNIATRRDRSLSGLIVALAVAEMKLEGKIAVKR
jgi:hypothetical protein